MQARPHLMAPVAALLTLAACGPGPDAATEPVVVRTVMAGVMTPRSDEILNILIDAMAADGAVDPAKLDDADWSALQAAAAALHDGTVGLGDAGRPIRVVAAPGDVIDGEAAGGLTAADVQARIDARPDDFRALAQPLIAAYAGMAAAAEARDAGALWELALGMDQKCTACHLQFWNPDVEEGAP